MTIFSDNPYDRRMEQLMMTVPNFAPRGVGFRFTEAQIFITATAATPTEILTATMRQIRCPPFRKRFNEYIESEENPMTYINEKHRTRFTLAAKNVHRENYALLSALYLLTADQRLWSCCKHHINNGCVFFENIKLNNCSERAYTLYCAAKDLTLGTKHITVSDLSDADLVPPMLFRTIASQGKVEKVGTSPSNVDYSKLTPGDIIIFGNSSSSHVHAAIFAGVYNGKHFIIHVGNERGPEINTTEGMAHSSNGDKASTPNGYYHLPDELFIENGFMEVKKTDENGKALAGAVFVATNQKTGKAYKIGPTNASGYPLRGAHTHRAEMVTCGYIR